MEQNPFASQQAPALRPVPLRHPQQMAPPEIWDLIAREALVLGPDTAQTFRAVHPMLRERLDGLSPHVVNKVGGALVAHWLQDPRPPVQGRYLRTYLARLSALDLAYRPALAKPLCNLPYLFRAMGQIKTINLRQCGLTSANIQHIALRTLPHVETMVLSGNRLGLTGFWRVPLHNWDPIKHLDLSDNILSGHVGGSYSFEPMQSLVSLNLSQNFLTDHDLELLKVADAPVLRVLKLRGNAIQLFLPASMQVERLRRLERLDLSHNELWDLQDDGSPHIIMPRLACLNLAYNGISGEALLRLPLGRFPDLQSLGLHANFISPLPFGGWPMQDVTTLKSLDLSCNHLEASDMLLLNLKRLPNLEHLNLAHNKLGPQGAGMLALGHTQLLRRLDISYNALGLLGACALAVDQVPHLQRLNVMGNGLGPTGAGALRFAGAKELLAVDLRGNFIKKRDVPRILDAWQLAGPAPTLRIN